MVDPSRTLPILQFFMHTDLFRAAVFPGFMFAAVIAAVTIFVERKLLAKMQLRIGPLYAGKVEGIFQLVADGLKLLTKEIIVLQELINQYSGWLQYCLWLLLRR